MLEGPVKTYVVSKGWRTAAVIFALLFVPGGVSFFWLPSLCPGPTPIAVTVFVFAFGGFCIFGTLFLLASSFRYRFEVWDDKVRSLGMRGVKEMRLDDIAGFEYTQKASGGEVVLVSKNKPRKLRIAVVFGDWEGLWKWLEDHFTDLTALKVSKEMDAVLGLEGLGADRDQRVLNLKRIKRRTILAGLLACLFAYWGFLHPRPYGLFIWGNVLLPFLGVGLLVLYPGIFKFGVGPRSPYVTVDYFFALPIIMLAGRAFLDWNIFDWSPFWMPFAGFTMFLFVLLLAFSRDARSKNFMKVLWLVYCALYGYGASICLNGVLDHNAPAQYTAKVAARRMITGRPPEYYMTLSPWGPVPEEREYKVYGNVYRHRLVGDTVIVSLKNGAFHIPYYSVSFK